MNTQNILHQLRQKYPGKTIIKLPEKNPTEILCEIEPTSKHPEYSEAISIIDQTTPHYHKKTTEIYEIIKGQLTLTVNNKKYTLTEGDQHIIKPGQTHSATGNETWIKATSTPGWIPDDHILC